MSSMTKNNRFKMSIGKGLLTAFSILTLSSAFAADEAAAPANLFDNGDFHNTATWRSAFYVDPAPGRDQKAVTDQLRKASEKSFTAGDNGHVYAKIVVPESFETQALSGYSTTFDLKEVLKEDHECCFSFRYRGTTANPKKSYFYAVVNYINGHKHFGNKGMYGIPLTKEWTQKEIRFKVSAGTKTMGINMGINGTGTCEFGDIVVTLTPIAPAK